MIRDFVDEYARYKAIGQRAMEQVSEAALNRKLARDGNSIAMLVRHLGGNLTSRFTDFLTTDGEKPWRHRDAEFEERAYSLEEVHKLWTSAFQVLESQLARLGQADLQSRVQIRGGSLTVHEALCRSLAHTAYHVGQIVLLCRAFAEDEWRFISIPKGKSEEYNKDPTLEKRPR